MPHIVRWPGVVQAGQVNDELICLVDWYATLADVHGVKLEDDQAEDSFSFFNLLGGGNVPNRKSLIHHSGGGTFAIRRGDWKLIEGNLGSREN